MTELLLPHQQGKADWSRRRHVIEVAGMGVVLFFLNENGITERKGRTGKVAVELRPGESQESLLRRFRREVTKGRVLSEVRRRRWFVSKSEQRRIAKRKGIRKARRRQRQQTRTE